MGHQSDLATEGLRACAGDLQTPVGGQIVLGLRAAKQDDASIQFSGSGAPHQLAIMAGIVCVVLLGGIAFADAFGLTSKSVSAQQVVVADSQGDTIVALVRREKVSLANAIRGFSDLGMTWSTEALIAARNVGMDDNVGVQNALERLAAVAAGKYAAEGTVSELDFDVIVAVLALEQAVRPPGLDPDRLLPGEGGPPPGQDPDFIPPGQDPEFVPPRLEIVPPSQKPDVSPPGLDSDNSTSGQDKAKSGGTKGRP